MELVSCSPSVVRRSKPTDKDPKRVTRSLILGLSIWFFVIPNEVTQAQSTVSTRNSTTSTWLIYVGDHPISKSWVVHLEGAGFWHGVGGTKELVYARPGIRRQFSNGLSSMLTYNYFVTEPFFTGAPSPQREHRIAEDLQWKRTLFGSKNSLTNRVRMEQRFLAPTSPNQNADSWHFAERLRYRLTADFSLPWKDAAPGPDYVWLYDEPFVNIGPHQTSGILAQNLSTGGLGWNLSSHAQLEVGYMLQYTPSPAGMTGAFNHILLITLLSDHPFTRRK